MYIIKSTKVKVFALDARFWTNNTQVNKKGWVGGLKFANFVHIHYIKNVHVGWWVVKKEQNHFLEVIHYSLICSTYQWTHQIFFVFWLKTLKAKGKWKKFISKLVIKGQLVCLSLHVTYVVLKTFLDFNAWNVNLIDDIHICKHSKKNTVSAVIERRRSIYFWDL